MFRLATFNLESLDAGPDVEPPLEDRLPVLRPQLARLRADVLCLQEVNAQKPDADGPRVLAALDDLLDGTPYAGYHRAAVERSAEKGPADRHNLVILSRFPIERRAQHRHDLLSPPAYRPVSAQPRPERAEPVTWDRPLLYARLRLGDGAALHVVNLHLRAPIAAPVAGQKESAGVWRSVGGWAEGFYLAAMKRSGQALEARLLVERLLDDDPEALIAVCGDLNADEHEVPVRLLRGDEEDTGNGALAGRVLVPAQRAVPAGQRFSVIHKGRAQTYDHILVSRHLLARLRGAEIHNEDLGDEALAPQAVRRPPDSYHAPVVATFGEDGDGERDREGGRGRA